MGRAEDIFADLRARGEATIDDLIAARQVEELFLDFKRSADSGSGSKLHQNDRANLAKAISGFGNSEGGVVIWGVDASQDIVGADVARAKVPITNIKRFEGWLQGVVSGCTLPAHSLVEHLSIDAGSGNGYVATLIPKSPLAPHQCVTDYKYYMRAGSSFQPVTHSVIAGMMGRRPQPLLFENWGIKEPAQVVQLPTDASGQRLPDGIKMCLELILVNKGPGLARDLFANVKFAIPGPNCQQWIDVPSENWIMQLPIIPEWRSIVSQDTYKLAPESWVPTIAVTLALVPPFLQDLWMQWSFGCDEAPTIVKVLTTTADDVNRLYHEFLRGPCDSSSSSAFVRKLFSLPTEDLSEPIRQAMATNEAEEKRG